MDIDEVIAMMDRYPDYRMPFAGRETNARVVFSFAIIDFRGLPPSQRFRARLTAEAALFGSSLVREWLDLNALLVWRAVFS